MGRSASRRALAGDRSALSAVDNERTGVCLPNYPDGDRGRRVRPPLRCPTPPMPLLRVVDAVDALNAIELSLPDGFSTGLVPLFLDEHRVAIAAFAVEHAPSDDTHVVPTFLADLLTSDSPLAFATASVVLGVVRLDAPLTKNERTDTPDDGGVLISTSELIAWMTLSRHLRSVHVVLDDVVILEPHGWTALSQHVSVPVTRGRR